MSDSVIFPPMDEATFQAKLARWNARGPRPSKYARATLYGRPSLKRIPREQFAAHVESDDEEVSMRSPQK